MKEIKLTKNKSVIVDDVWFPIVSQWRWHYSNGYAVRNIGTRENKELVFMHRYITMAPKCYQVDHINQNKLDNTMQNLRLVKPEKNYINRKMLPSNKTGFKGVCWDAKRGRYIASIQYQNKHYTLGRYNTKEEAALAYNDAAKRLHGEYAYLNVV